MHKWVNISDIGNDNVELLEIGVMFNCQEWRIFNGYIHVDNVTNDICGIS